MATTALRIVTSGQADLAPLAAQIAGLPQVALPLPPPKPPFQISLLAEGLVAPHAMIEVLAVQARGAGRLIDGLLARGLVVEPALYAALSRHHEAPLVDLTRHAGDPHLVTRLGAAFCLRAGLLPVRGTGERTLIATADPEDFERHRAVLEEALGPVAMALAPRHAIEERLSARHGASLARDAEICVPVTESCRTYGRGPVRMIAALALTGIAALTVLSAQAVLVAVFAWAALTLMAVTSLKIAAALAMWRSPLLSGPAPIIARLPVVSVMVALYREASIAGRLVRRLSRLDYPRDLLDIVLVVEAEDGMTRAALAAAALPHWMRVVVVPGGRVRTKPRALNYALGHCRGSVIGVYDAEDAPEPDQITRVVERFHARSAEVACLQGVLDFYNPRSNWLARCFTLEYATWFRLMLPGMARLGLAVPLGGTTLFFRRAALEAVGAWDAWNVTEDADLGIRLARHGYRTELIDTVTYEEANCRPGAWVRQRSRWIKGYMMTWLVHMRDPVLLWQQLGPWRFAGFQVTFAASLSQFLFAPILWSFWIVAAGLPHPVADVMSDGMMLATFACFVGAEAVSFLLGVLALRRTRHRLNPLWLLTLPFYFPLAALAAYKAAWEMVMRPFFWDKTSHGHFDSETVEV